MMIFINPADLHLVTALKQSAWAFVIPNAMPHLFFSCATLWQKNMLSLQGNKDSYDAILKTGRRPLL